LNQSSAEDQEAVNSSKPFDHKPLSYLTDAVRLVNLFPGRPPDPIKCGLIHTTLSQNPEYEALSYTWGIAYATLPIIVDGKDMTVTENLRQALINLRSLVKNRVLWIDAICINQSNVHERNHQVQQMGEIYSRASEVTIWLGLETETGTGILSVLGWASRSSLFCMGFIERQSGYMHVGSRFNEAWWGHLERLYTHEYWRRVWIIQEVVLASRLKIQWGNSSVSWTGIEKLFEEINLIKSDFHTSSTITFLQSPPAQLERLRRGYKGTGGCSLLDLLEFSKDSLCSDSKDKVYSLLGLATDCRKQEILADYSRSMYDIYETVLRYYTSRGHRSTVVRFGQFLQISFGLSSEKAQHERCSDRGTGAWKPNSEEMVETYGIFRGPIVYLSQPWETNAKFDAKSFMKFINLEKFTLEEHLHVLDSLLSNTTVADAQRMCPMPNSYSYGKILANPSRRSTMASLDSLNHVATQNCDSLQLDACSSDLALPTSLTSTKTATLFHNNFLFVDETGQIGLAPKEAQVGDLVCQFHGCDVAVIVRKQADKYVLIGRVLLAKRCDEECARSGDAPSSNFKFSVPDSGSWDNFRNEITFYFDIASFQLVTF
jgi:Heterokaryon incompatibility protein (HET)